VNSSYMQIWKIIGRWQPGKFVVGTTQADSASAAAFQHMPP